MRFLLAVIAMAFALTSVHAVEVVDVRFEDRVRLGDRVVVVNGAGLRKKAFFKIYAMALYLPERRSDGASIIALEGGGSGLPSIFCEMLPRSSLLMHSLKGLPRRGCPESQCGRISVTQKSDQPVFRRDVKCRGSTGRNAGFSRLASRGWDALDGRWAPQRAGHRR